MIGSQTAVAAASIEAGLGEVTVGIGITESMTSAGAFVGVVPTATQLASAASSVSSGSIRSFRSVISSATSAVAEAPTEGIRTLGNVSSGLVREYMAAPHVIQVRSTPIGAELDPTISAAVAAIPSAGNGR
ncbi:unnamed protein product, partial [Brenthis ino]